MVVVGKHKYCIKLQLSSKKVLGAILTDLSKEFRFFSYKNTWLRTICFSIKSNEISLTKKQNLVCPETPGNTLYQAS